MPKIKDISLVAVQFLLILAFFLDIQWFSIRFMEHFVWFYLGMLGVVITVAALLQMNFHLSPFPTPKPNSKLITTGAYRLSRHPMYTGILIFMFSFSFWLGDGYKLCVSLAILVLFYYKTNYEESLLESMFDDYKAYKSKTGRFYPKF
ncbi:isoprenylcysteine carboxylmethyltransferase family protein [Psychroflexus sp. YR1-1]|uniref:Isoprenylcysteine carboxylmethyltransferase family protein n=1 Tax=Psychroflexus aurantiacus TaxID=2709310 RepID=A0A6B3R2A8_9FLAO|nr:isoprenylcysteine carboxylmethyltransferase family protein [Psychroflexus aurantiacus]NEV93620.1 isoprenylcysteine carboxylmethyltransferase family protein [Psychroflexus aurantiacus]